MAGPPSLLGEKIGKYIAYGSSWVRNQCARPCKSTAVGKCRDLAVRVAQTEVLGDQARPGPENGLYEPDEKANHLNLEAEALTEIVKDSRTPLSANILPQYLAPYATDGVRGLGVVALDWTD
jgi:hypothetical protein